MEWKSLKYNPLEEGDEVIFWHEFWKCPIAGKLVGDQVIEKTKTTMWPIEAFTHWAPMVDEPFEVR